MKRYQLTYPTFSKQTVHEFKKADLKEKEAINKEVTILKSRKRGLSKLLLQNIMAKTIQTVKALRVKGAPVSSAVTNAIAKGVVMAEINISLRSMEAILPLVINGRGTS